MKLKEMEIPMEVMEMSVKEMEMKLKEMEMKLQEMEIQLLQCKFERGLLSQKKIGIRADFLINYKTSFLSFNIF